MSNVIRMGLPHRPGIAQRQAVLLHNFATRRRQQSDVYWLKENAECLNILATTDAHLPDGALAVYQKFYERIEERLQFFPQYYRFLLSVCLDLEDLGMEGGHGEVLCERVIAGGFVEAELSDLQRAEAHRLLARRIDPTPDRLLDARLRRFISRPQTFALPNKKAAYELTHIVFYLSDYGRVAPETPDEVVVSLEFAGLLAYLDQDVDLLAEVCVALQFCGQSPSPIWEDWLTLQAGGFVLTASSTDDAQDAYHEYLVTSWWEVLSGAEGFRGRPGENGLTVHRHGTSQGPLRAISEYMYHLGSARSADWGLMRVAFQDVLGEQEHNILEGAAQSSRRFGDFFEGFSRANN